VPEALTTEGFIVSLRAGRATRVDATDPGEFLTPLAGAELAWINVEVGDLARDGGAVATTLGFSAGLVELLLRDNATSAYEDRDVELGLVTPMIRVQEMDVVSEPLVVLLRGNLVLTLYRRGKATRFQKFGRYAETVMRKIAPDSHPRDKLTLLVMRILDENNERNFDGIRPIEDAGEKLSGQLAQMEFDRVALAQDIYRLKRALINYLDALWDSIDTIYALQHGDAELISDDETLLHRIEVLGEDVQRHIQLSEHMSEVLSSGLEVTQSIYNNQLQALNNRLAYIVTWLTVLGTAVLVPNTLATVLGAAPPELRIESPGLYAAVMVGSTGLATMAAYYWTRRAARLPKRMD
jgi:magnesium transporter